MSSSPIERDVACSRSTIDGQFWETHLASSTTAVEDTVRPRAVPRHANKQPAIVAKVGRPPVLRVRHQGSQVRLERIVVERIEGGRVVKVRAQRIRDVGVLAEDVELQRVGPPVAVAGAAAADVHLAVDRALFLGHCVVCFDGITWILDEGDISSGDGRSRDSGTKRGRVPMSPRYMRARNNRWQQRVTNPFNRTGPRIRSTEGG